MEKIFYLTFVCLLSKFLLAEPTVNLFSARQAVLMDPLIIAFQKKTNIKVNIIAAKAGQLINRIELEDKYTKADILLTTDVGRLIYAKNKDFFRKVNSTTLSKSIPKRFRDEENKWFGLSLRSRVFIYNTDKVNNEELSGYYDLSNKNWKGRIMVRSSNNVYNQSLIAAMILNYGEKKVENFLQNFVSNFARKPSGGDRDQIKAVANGQGDIALVNSYYFLKMKLNDRDNFLKKTAIHFPQDNIMKTHVNISGAGIIKFTKNYNHAVRFLEYLVSEEAQKIYADVNYEYPVNSNVQISSRIQPYVIPEQDNLDLSILGSANKKALLLMDRAGWK